VTIDGALDVGFFLSTVRGRGEWARGGEMVVATADSVVRNGIAS